MTNALTTGLLITGAASVALTGAAGGDVAFFVLTFVVCFGVGALPAVLAWVGLRDVDGPLRAAITGLTWGLSVVCIVIYGSLQVTCGGGQVDTTALVLTKVGQRVEIHSLRNGIPTLREFSGVFPDGLPVDAWGHPIEYLSPGPDGHAFDLVSLGADGQLGGTGNNADLWYSSL